MPESRFTQGAVLTTLLAGLAVLLLAAGRTVGDPQPRPTRLARPPRRRPRPTRSPLRRLLRLPVLATGAPCPVEQAHRVDPAFAEVLGTGPAYPTAGAEPWWQGWVEGGWYYAKVLWVANPAHPGPFLVRGRQLDGPRQLRFGEGPRPDTELLLPAAGRRTD